MLPRAFARFAALFRLELRAHLTHWRSWFSFVLVAVLSVKAIFTAGPETQTALGLVASAQWLIPAFAALILLMGVETAAECRRPGLASILWTKPFSSLNYAAARLAALFAVLAALLCVPFVAHWAIARRLWNVDYSVAPSIWLILYWAWPAALGLGALALWTRTLFDHRVAALAVAAGLAWGIFDATARFRLGLAGFDGGAFESLLSSYHPAAGSDLFHPPFLWGLAKTALLACFLTVLGACHLRRIEPAPIRTGHGRVFGFPTFRQTLQRLAIDPSAGAEVVAALALSALAVGGVTTFDLVNARKQEAREQQWAAAIAETLPQRFAPLPAVKFARVDAEIALLDRERVQVDASLRVVNPRATPMETALFSLSPTLDIESIQDERGRPASFERFGDCLAVQPPEPLPPATTETLRLRYAGRVTRLTVGAPDPFTRRYAVALTPIRYSAHFPVIRSRDVLPVPVAAIGGDRPRLNDAPSAAPHLLKVRLYGGLRAFCPDQTNWDVQSAADGGAIRIDEPVSDVQLLAGPYVTIEGEYGGLPARAHCFTRDRDILQVAFTLASLQFERIRKVLGPPPEGRLTYIESVDPSWTSIPAREIPAQILIDMRKRERDWRLEDREAIGVYQEAVNRLCSLTVGGYFATRLRFAPPIAPLRRGLFLMLSSDLEREDIRRSALRVSRVFNERVSLDQGLVRGNELTRFSTPFVSQDETRGTVEAAESIQKEKTAAMLWRMLRYLLGDERFVGFLQDLVAERAPIPLERLQSLAEARYGESLEWFFGHWFRETGIPRYEIQEAKAWMVENDKTHEIDYDVRVVVANRGRGRMPTPVLVHSERDEITRQLWLDSQSSATLALRMPYRPEFAVVDPQGWIIQEAEWRADRRSSGRPMRLVEIEEK